MKVEEYNSAAWDGQVTKGNEWTKPVDSRQIELARCGHWDIYLTPTKPIPRDWFPELRGLKVLCLASGGGQQGPILAAAGACVTVFDNSQKQLDQDDGVAGREHLKIATLKGDMADLSLFSDGCFDLIVHPVSNVFAKNVLAVWREAYRVLRPGGTLLAGFDNALSHIFDYEAYVQGELVVKYPIPYSDLESLPRALLEKYTSKKTPLEFGHSLEDQIKGQLDCGFIITGFYEDKNNYDDLLNRYISTFIATRAVKRTI